MNRRCERKGHKPIGERRRGYTRCPRWYRAVADYVCQERIICKRCGETLSAWTERDSRGINELSMSNRSWETLRVEGELWDEHERVAASEVRASRERLLGG